MRIDFCPDCGSGHAEIELRLKADEPTLFVFVCPHSERSVILPVVPVPDHDEQDHQRTSGHREHQVTTGATKAAPNLIRVLS